MRSNADTRRYAAIGALLLAVAFQSASAQDEEPGKRYLPVVPPGQDDLLATMLGRGTALPEACRFIGGAANGPLVQVKYVCPAGEVVFDLVHPSVAPYHATETERFALTLQSGNPPGSLANALASLIRSRESAFQWSLQTVGDGADADSGTR